MGILFFSLFFVSILILTILKECPKLDSFFNKYHIIASFLPNWSFFAPIPGMHDYILRIRYYDEKGEQPSDWKILQKKIEKRSYISIFWNPKKKLSKILFDVINDLIQFNNKVRDLNYLRLSTPYLQLLNFINGREHPDSKKYIQFSIFRYSRIYKEELLFQSDIHPIE
jgi:hypothetical protein